MPRPYPPEFPFHAVDLVRVDKPITTAAIEFRHQRRRAPEAGAPRSSRPGERPGLTTTESAQLSKANKRIRQFQGETEILRTAATLFGQNRPVPKGFTRRSTPRRRRAPGKGLLQTSRRQPPSYYIYKTPTDVTDADAPSGAHGFDPPSPHGFTSELRVSTCACGAHTRYEHRGQ